MNTHPQKLVTLIPSDCALGPLEKNALAWLNDAAGYEDGATGRYRDLARGGCISGIVGHLIYSRDCKTFLNLHRKEINDWLGEMLLDLGVKSPAEVLCDWDETDPLGENLNVDKLAWFGFETAARAVAQKAGIEL